MKTSVSIFRYFGLILWVLSHSVTADSIQNHFTILNDIRIENEYIYSDINSQSTISCAYECSKNSSCESASYKEIDSSCSLSVYRVDGIINQDKTSSSSSWITLFKDGCLDDGIEIGEACYTIYEVNLNYTQAKDFCTQKSGKLAEPPTLASFELLRNYTFQTSSNSYWIGLNDISVENQFVLTSTGLAPSYYAWRNGEPNQGNNADCVYIYRSIQFGWGDSSCTSSHGLICET